jgi:hypothetical protein
MPNDRTDAAGDDQCARSARVVELADTHEVARTEKTATHGVPEREREVAGEMIDACVAPRFIGVEDRSAFVDACIGHQREGAAPLRFRRKRAPARAGDGHERNHEVANEARTVIGRSPQIVTPAEVTAA